MSFGIKSRTRKRESNKKPLFRGPSMKKRKKMAGILQ